MFRFPSERAEYFVSAVFALEPIPIAVFSPSRVVVVFASALLCCFWYRVLIHFHVPVSLSKMGASFTCFMPSTSLACPVP